MVRSVLVAIFVCLAGLKSSRGKFEVFQSVMKVQIDITYWLFQRYGAMSALIILVRTAMTWYKSVSLVQGDASKRSLVSNENRIIWRKFKMSKARNFQTLLMLDTGNGLMQTDKQCGAPIDRNEGCDVIDVPIQVGAQLKHTMPCLQLLLRMLSKSARLSPKICDRLPRWFSSNEFHDYLRLVSFIAFRISAEQWFN